MTAKKTISHIELGKRLETDLKKKGYTTFSYLEEVPGFIDANKEYYDSILFNWDEVPGNENLYIEEYLKDKFEYTWVRNTIITKTKNIIKIKDKSSSNTITLTKNDHKIILESLDKKKYHLSINEEGGKTNVYEKKEQLIIDPNLPVDTISCKKSDGNSPQYSIFLIISTDYSKNTLEKRVNFYKYYLSRIEPLKDLKIVSLQQKI